MFKRIAVAIATSGLMVSSVGAAQATSSEAELSSSIVKTVEQNPGEAPAAKLAQLDASLARSGSMAEQGKILRDAGFKKVNRPAGAPSSMHFYEHETSAESGDGTLMWAIGDDGPRQEINVEVTQASVGFSWRRGPYIKATIGEWYTMVKYGGVVGVGLCGLIGSVPGAVSCGIIGSLVMQYLGDNPPSSAEKKIPLCINPITKSFWVC